MTRYIHELPDWPRFRWDSAALSTKLAALRHRQGRIAGRIENFGIALRAEAALRTLTEDAVKSSEIEEEYLNRDHVRSSVARHLGMERGALRPTDRTVEGVVTMILDATQHYKRPLTPQRLFGWHKGLFPGGRSGYKQIVTGAWRTSASGPMHILSGHPGREHIHFEAPAAARLGEEMQKFLGWLNGDADGVDAVLRAAIAHFWFVTIHPFEDGNGRIGRAIADMMLARSEHSAQRFYSMSAQIRKERSRYYDFLEKTQKGDLDITAHLDWFLDCMDRALSGAEIILADIIAKARFWERHAGASFNKRQHLMLNRLLDGFTGKLTSSKWALMAKCSQDSAGRDIDDLVKRGILAKQAAGGRSTSYALTPIMP